MAAKVESITVTGTITGISDHDDNVQPAGYSVRWIFSDRELTGLVDGDIKDSFKMGYSVDVIEETQVGTIHGQIIAGSYIFKISGKIQTLEFYPYNLSMLTITGQWTLPGDTIGQGNFFAQVVFVPTPEGHVDYIVESLSDFNLTGQWQPDIKH